MSRDWVTLLTSPATSQYLPPVAAGAQDFKHKLTDSPPSSMGDGRRSPNTPSRQETDSDHQTPPWRQCTVNVHDALPYGGRRKEESGPFCPILLVRHSPPSHTGTGSVS